MPAPFLAPLLVSGASALGSAAARAIPTSADRENRRRLEELLELERGGDLGLTGQERQVAEQRSQDALAAQASQQADITRQMLAGQQAQGGVGAALAAQQGQGEQLARATQDAIGQMEALDLEKKQLQRQEIEDRQARRGALQARNVEAFSSAITDLVDAGVAQHSHLLTALGQPGLLARGRGAKFVEGFTEDELAILKKRYGRK